MNKSIALVTGATSGIGYAAARALGDKGWQEIIVTGRSLAGIRKTAAQLAAETRKRVFASLELDLNAPEEVQSALDELVKRGRQIDFLLLNAGWIGGKARVLTAAGVETTFAPLVGHHQLTIGLLNANLLSPNARIVISGSEVARGDIPLFNYTDVPALAAKEYQGGRTAAVKALLNNGPNLPYQSNRAHADAKMVVVWWAAALARKLPPGMAIFTVSPGSTPDTKGIRNLGPAVRWLMVPLVKRIPGMAHSPEVAANRYLQALDFGADDSGKFFASPPRKFTGPLQMMRHPHFHDSCNQIAAWEAIVDVSGTDLA